MQRIRDDIDFNLRCIQDEQLFLPFLEGAREKYSVLQTWVETEHANPESWAGYVHERLSSR